MTKWIIGRLAPTAIVCLLFLCTTPIFGKDEAKFGKIRDKDRNIWAPEKYPEANAVIIFDHGRMIVTIDNIDIYYHVRMKVLNPAGIDEVGDIEITYDDEWETLKDFEAHTITPDGKKHKVKGDAIFERKAGRYKTRTFSFPSVEVGSIVEYKYNIRKVKGYRFLKPWYFQNRLYTYESQFTVELAQGFSYNLVYQNVPFDLQKPAEDRRMDINSSLVQRYIMIYTWTIEDLVPIRSEPYMSSVNDYRMAVRFRLDSFQDSGNNISYLVSWSEVGERFTEFLDDYCNREKRVREMAKQMTAGISDPREKARALFDHVVSEYKTSYDGDGRWFIHDKMSKMLEEKYESAEGKNVLLAELYQAAGIPAWPVLISTRDNARFDPRFPGTRWFNYILVFAQFGDRWEFLDTSSRYSIFGILPPECLTDGGFLIDGDNSELVQIAVKATESYRSDCSRLHIADDGFATCTTMSRFGGYYASTYTSRFDKRTPEKFAERYYLDKLDGDCRLDSCRCISDSAAGFAVCIDFSSSDLVERLDNNLLVRPLQFAFRENPFKSEKRFFPVDFNYPFVYQSITELILPPGTDSDFILPEEISTSFEGIAFDRRAYRPDSTVIVETKLQVYEPLIEPHFYGQVRDFFETVALSTEDVMTAVLKGESAAE